MINENSVRFFFLVFSQVFLLRYIIVKDCNQITVFFFFSHFELLGGVLPMTLSHFIFYFMDFFLLKFLGLKYLHGPSQTYKTSLVSIPDRPTLFPPSPICNHSFHFMFSFLY